jgi:hypothetical protein
MVHPVKRLQQKLEILQLDFVDDEVSGSRVLATAVSGA